MIAEFGDLQVEKDFAKRIDCAFPYDDENAGLKLVEEAARISVNACFAVAHELCGPPGSASAPVTVRLLLLGRLRRAFAHPVRDDVLDVADLMIRGGELTVPGAIALLQRISGHPPQYAALNIVYFAADDENGQLDAEYNRICDQWKAL